MGKEQNNWQDTDRVLTEISEDWYPSITEVPWEGIMQEDGFFKAIFLANNSFGIVFVIPDAEWVNGKLSKVILENLDP